MSLRVVVFVTVSGPVCLCIWKLVTCAYFTAYMLRVTMRVSRVKVLPHLLSDDQDRSRQLLLGLGWKVYTYISSVVKMEQSAMPAIDKKCCSGLCSAVQLFREPQSCRTDFRSLPSDTASLILVGISFLHHFFFYVYSYPLFVLANSKCG